jgi:hypothetical protein
MLYKDQFPASLCGHFAIFLNFFNFRQKPSIFDENNMFSAKMHV